MLSGARDQANADAHSDADAHSELIKLTNTYETQLVCIPSWKDCLNQAQAGSTEAILGHRAIRTSYE